MRKYLVLALFPFFFQGCLAHNNAMQSHQQTATQADAPASAAQQNQQAKSAAQPAVSVVCIDPGHPSETSSGNVLQNGTTEVHIAWVVGLKLKTLLEAEGVKVVLTKSKEEQVVTNKERAMPARTQASPSTALTGKALCKTLQAPVKRS
jgi:N-acetylmuramoyl-L-alanine amidase